MLSHPSTCCEAAASLATYYPSLYCETSTLSPTYQETQHLSVCSKRLVLKYSKFLYSNNLSSSYTVKFGKKEKYCNRCLNFGMKNDPTKMKN